MIQENGDSVIRVTFEFRDPLRSPKTAQNHISNRTRQEKDERIEKKKKEYGRSMLVNDGMKAAAVDSVVLAWET